MDKALPSGPTKRDIDAVVMTLRAGADRRGAGGVSFAKSAAHALGAADPRPSCAGAHRRQLSGLPDRAALHGTGYLRGNRLIVDVADYTDMTVLAPQGRRRRGVLHKAARVLGLPYPGGKPMDELAQQSQGGNTSVPPSAHVSGAELI